MVKLGILLAIVLTTVVASIVLIPASVGLKISAAAQMPLSLTSTSTTTKNTSTSILPTVTGITSTVRHIISSPTSTSIVGKVPVGGVCKASSECVSGLVCANGKCVIPITTIPPVIITPTQVGPSTGGPIGFPTSTQSPGTVQNGGACTASSECGSGLACTNNVCMSTSTTSPPSSTSDKVAVNGACTANTDCVSTAICQNSLCKEPIGAPCGSDFDCASSGPDKPVCLFGKCTTPCTIQESGQGC